MFVVTGLLIVVSGSVSLIFVRLMMLKTTPDQSIKKLLLHFVFSVASSHKARALLPKFRETLERPGYYQERILHGIIKDNKDTSYGKDYGLVSMRNINDFRSIL